jgi:predicted N-acetyltransferase YhbS
MYTRTASPFDVNAIINLLREYRAEMPYGFLADANDEAHIRQLLASLLAGQGLVLVAEVDGKTVGILMAGVMPSIWSPKHFLLTEFAYFVTPEYRGSTAGYRLMRQYLDEAIVMRESGRITNFFISKMVNSPDLNFGRFGFQKLEEFWVM